MDKFLKLLKKKETLKSCFVKKIPPLFPSKIPNFKNSF